MRYQPRKQLSLFAPPEDAVELEAIRKRLDPVQHRLIPAHVTATRDAETEALLDNGVDIEERLDGFQPITLAFGAAERFSRHGISLRCIDGGAAFAELRRRLLGSLSQYQQAPHITLAHPRNPKTTANDRFDPRALPERITFTFASLRLIEQTRDAPWRTVRLFRL